MLRGVYYRTKKMRHKNGLNFGDGKGINNSRYKEIGSIRTGLDGYKWIKISINKWIHLHRYLVKKYLGFKLKKGWIVHHIDFNELNNKLSNLYIFKSNGYHCWFSVLVKRGILDKFVLKSNLKEIKYGR